jgi:hypothetical protein
MTGFRELQYQRHRDAVAVGEQDAVEDWNQGREEEGLPELRDEEEEDPGMYRIEWYMPAYGHSADHPLVQEIRLRFGASGVEFETNITLNDPVLTRRMYSLALSQNHLYNVPVIADQMYRDTFAGSTAYFYHLIHRFRPLQDGRVSLEVEVWRYVKAPARPE